MYWAEDGSSSDDDRYQPKRCCVTSPMTSYRRSLARGLESKLRLSVGWTTAILCGRRRRLYDVVRTARNADAVAVPVAVVLHDVDDVITVRVH